MYVYVCDRVWRGNTKCMYVIVCYCMYMYVYVFVCMHVCMYIAAVSCSREMICEEDCVGAMCECVY